MLINDSNLFSIIEKELLRQKEGIVRLIQEEEKLEKKLDRLQKSKSHKRRISSLSEFICDTNNEINLEWISMKKVTISRSGSLRKGNEIVDILAIKPFGASNPSYTSYELNSELFSTSHWSNYSERKRKSQEEIASDLLQEAIGNLITKLLSQRVEALRLVVKKNKRIYEIALKISKSLFSYFNFEFKSYPFYFKTHKYLDIKTTYKNFTDLIENYKTSSNHFNFLYNESKSIPLYIRPIK